MQTQSTLTSTSNYKVQYLDLMKFEHRGEIRNPFIFKLETNLNSVKFTFTCTKDKLKKSLIIAKDNFYKFDDDRKAVNDGVVFERIEKYLETKFISSYISYSNILEKYLLEIEKQCQKVLGKSFIHFHPLFPINELNNLPPALIACKTKKELAKLVLNSSKEAIEIINYMLQGVDKIRDEFNPNSKGYPYLYQIISSNNILGLLLNTYDLTNRSNVNPNLIIKEFHQGIGIDFIRYCTVKIFELFSPSIAFKLIVEDYKKQNDITWEIYPLFEKLKQFNIVWEFPRKITYKNLIWHYDRMTEALEVAKHDKELPKTINSLEGIKVLDYTIVVPKNSRDLVKWGRILSNCLKTYVKQVVNEECYIIGLFKDNELKYCAELGSTKLNIKQFKGFGNSEVDAIYWKELEQVLNQNKSKVTLKPDTVFTKELLDILHGLDEVDLNQDDNIYDL